jgi:hypothetical protein
MKMSQENLEKMITKMVSVIKPNGVLGITFRLEPLGIRDDEYYMNITYIVPDDSPYLKRSTSTRTFDDIRNKWNSSLRQSIKNFFNTEVIINSSGISSESFYKQKNQ